MKISVIAPITPPGVNPPPEAPQTPYKSKYADKACCVNLPAEFEFLYLDDGPKVLRNTYDSAYAAPELIRKAVLAQNAGSDAIVINCTADTALRPCREAVSIPVIGPMESSMLYAAQFVDRYSVLTFAKEINHRFYRLARELGVSDRLVCAKSVEEAGVSCGTGRQDIVSALSKLIGGIFRETGCDGYILGCTDFEGFCYALGCSDTEGMEEELDTQLRADDIEAVFFKPFEIAVYQAYSSVLMGLHPGKSSYPRPHAFF